MLVANDILLETLSHFLAMIQLQQFHFKQRVKVWQVLELLTGLQTCFCLERIVSHVHSKLL